MTEINTRYVVSFHVLACINLCEEIIVLRKSTLLEECSWVHLSKFTESLMMGCLFIYEEKATHTIEDILPHNR